MAMRLLSCSFLLSTLSLLACPCAVGAEPQAEWPSEALQTLRRDFIAAFPRTGLNTAPGDAQFLRVMLEVAGCQRGVEIGAATGYGAIHMGLALERVGGQLVTIDINPKMVAATRENLARVRLDKTVTVIEGDALEVLPKLEGTFDFVFIDAVKKDYLRYFRAIEPRLRPGALIIADNVIQSAKDMEDFLTALRDSPDYHMAIIRASDLKKDGMAVIHKLR